MVLAINTTEISYNPWDPISSIEDEEKRIEREKSQVFLPPFAKNKK